MNKVRLGSIASRSNYRLGKPIVLGERCCSCSAEEPQNIAEQFQEILKIGKELLGEWDIDHVLSMAMDRVIEISGAERGMIILFDREDNILFETARNLKKEDIDHPEFEISRSIIDKVRAERTLVCHRNALEDPELRKISGLAPLKTHSVIGLPLSYKGKIFGVVYLDNWSVPEVFKPDTCTFVWAFADFISPAAYHALERTRLLNRVQALEAELRGRYRFESIVGHHPKMVAILKRVSQIAKSDVTVLIHGDSGTGKELIARALHYNSDRKDKPFVPINCGALPENLFESELFGYVRGAFTGAFKDKAGWFERADGGTILLDEISEMSPSLQVKLLRFLQTGEYSRVGSTEICYCDIRSVAATNKDLQELVKAGKFREDLYYRVNVIGLELPALRERKSDIPFLVRHFLQVYNVKCNKSIRGLSQKAKNLLLTYDFPGNIRELENAILCGVSLAEGELIDLHHLPMSIFSGDSGSLSKERSISLTEVKRLAARKAEMDVVEDCLRATRGHISKAAKMACYDVSNFHKLMRRYGISARDFKNYG